MASGWTLLVKSSRGGESSDLVAAWTNSDPRFLALDNLEINGPIDKQGDLERQKPACWKNGTSLDAQRQLSFHSREHHMKATACSFHHQPITRCHFPGTNPCALLG